MEKDTYSTLVTVSVPMWNASDTVRRAVDSLLGQTITAMKVVVVNDGGPSMVWEPLKDIDDPRLVRVDLPSNKGRYHADHVVLTKHCKSEWFAICDADDYVEPDWLEVLLAETPADVVLADHWVHPLKNPKVELSAVQTMNQAKTFEWRAHMAGLYRASWAREHHITNPHVRVGWDNVMTSIPFLLGDTKICRTPKYHRVRRAGSLTTDKATGVGSPYRRALVPQLKAAWRQIATGQLSVEQVVESMRPVESSMAHMVADKSFGNAWVLPKTTVAELDSRLWQLQPRTVLECGSGASTLVLARYAQRTGAKVVSLEHKGEFYQRTLTNLRKEGLRESVDLRMCKLDGGSSPWYVTDLPDNIDFVLIDGPPTGEGGRAATFPNIYPHLANDWEVWLDDGDREEEKEMARSWVSEFGVKSRYHRFPHGMLELRPKAFGRPSKIDASDLVISVLCGMRATLIEDTLESFPKQLLRDAHVMLIHNGADEATGKVVERFSSSIDHLIVNEELLSIGDNCQIAAEYAQKSGFKYWFHLEDDWAYDTFDHGWLDTAKEALEDPEIAQVRLRHVGQTVLTRHMVDNKRIVWTPHRRWLTAEAHLTTNPSLVRTSDSAKMWPAEGEKAMQKKALRAGMSKVAQLYPGAFHHTGDGQSLRAITNCAP
jgi:glycosyltransferase involved in cell wall biosynthesis